MMLGTLIADWRYANRLGVRDAAMILDARRSRSAREISVTQRIGGNKIKFEMQVRCIAPCRASLFFMEPA